MPSSDYRGRRQLSSWDSPSRSRSITTTRFRSPSSSAMARWRAASISPRPRRYRALRAGRPRGEGISSPYGAPPCGLRGVGRLRQSRDTMACQPWSEPASPRNPAGYDEHGATPPGPPPSGFARCQSSMRRATPKTRCWWVATSSSSPGASPARSRLRKHQEHRRQLLPRTQLDHSAVHEFLMTKMIDSPGL